MKIPTCICGSKNFQILRQGNYTCFTLPENPVAFQSLKCLDCGMVFTNPPPSPRLLADIDNNELANLESSNSERLTYRIERLKPYLNSQIKILEVAVLRES